MQKRVAFGPLLFALCFLCGACGPLEGWRLDVTYTDQQFLQIRFEPVVWLSLCPDPDVEILINGEAFPMLDAECGTLPVFRLESMDEVPRLAFGETALHITLQTSSSDQFILIDEGLEPAAVEVPAIVAAGETVSISHRPTSWLATEAYLDGALVGTDLDGLTSVTIPPGQAAGEYVLKLHLEPESVHCRFFAECTTDVSTTAEAAITVE